MFEPEKQQAILDFYATRERWAEILRLRTLRPQVGRVKNIFFGDSITEGWRLHEFFPHHSLLNRGLGGDNIYGLHYRLADDVLAYRPERVFMLIGINGIEEPQERILAHIQAVAEQIRQAGSAVHLCSILPLRHPDNWNRFQYQAKIVAINAELQRWAAENGAGFIDYHSRLKAADGQLAAEHAQPDGTHITFAAYCRMAELVRPLLAE